MRKHELVETVFQDYSEQDHLNFQSSHNNDNEPPPTTAQDNAYMKFRRDRLANKFWDQYQNYLRNQK
jgi:hypothetical protein